MEHKHTTGPWAHRNGRIFAADRENLTIAHVARAADGDYSPANGDVLAAAPDLLDALQKIPQRYMDDMDAHTTGVAQMIRAAIAKATGTQS